jgi:hypothetical protein
MLSSKEVIELTVKHINENGKCAVHNICKYYLDGNTCAVGLWLKNPEDFKNVNSDATELFRLYGTDILKEEVQHLPIDFWKDLQALHDDHYNYNYDESGKKLTEEAIDRMMKLKY